MNDSLSMCIRDSITSTSFTQNLYYHTGVGTARYNVSISSMTWKSGNESPVRDYKFTYDGLDRMLNACLLYTSPTCFLYFHRQTRPYIAGTPDAG